MIKLEDFKYPPHSDAEVYRAAIGKFNACFGLNTTAENMAYFIIGHQLPISKSNSNWLHMEPDIVTLSPVVTKLANSNPETEIRVFVSDESVDCHKLREAVSSIFQWSVMTFDNNMGLLKALTEFKPYIENKRVSYAICDAGKELGFAKIMLDYLLKNGIYYGSEIYIYTYSSMIKQSNLDIMEEFAVAGAYLGVITPALSSSDIDAVNFTVRYIERLASHINGNGDISYMISTDIMDVTLDFSTSGELQTLSFYFCEFKPYNNIINYHFPKKCSPGFYKVKDNSFEIGVKLNRKKTVKLLVFQDMTFLPSFEDMEISMAIQMIKIIFTSDISYSYEIVNVPSSSNVTVQETLVKTLNNPQTTYTMSAFPILLDPNLDVQYTHAVLYDGIVMIKIREATTVNLFHIFDVVSGFIWLCVFASLIFVALIFFAIKTVNDHQMKQMGETPEDDDISLFRQFFNVIYQNFSAVLLAKVRCKLHHIILLHFRVIFEGMP
ncbi:unnamed protein product [Hymenolepis diminuta]|uniref:Uncharacterized protein n=1 Tax=Hymenolepis diminuta TaxID=6216 RepID=A0A3P6Y0A3_HYMDI|nr:unnamed protein product [Hymenolepis diminuta]